VAFAADMFGDRTQPGNVPEAMAFITELRERRSLVAVFLFNGLTMVDFEAAAQMLLKEQVLRQIMQVPEIM
jgi:hypothetical protein